MDEKHDFVVGGVALPKSGRVGVRRETPSLVAGGTRREKQPTIVTDLRRLDETVVVWACIGSTTEKCSFGDEHEIVYFIRKRIWKTRSTHSTWVHGSDQRVEESVWVDGRGVKYFREQNVDFYSTTYWTRPGEDGRGSITFRSRPQLPSKRKSSGGREFMTQHSREYGGKGINGAPDGPGWEELPEHKKVRRT